MDYYLVGGAVRDALLGLPVQNIQDRDWLVVGSTPEQMLALGFRPVGKDFPVFLHPQTHEEYALARTERKTAPGYQGFAFHAAPDVTLEQDLARRDLTINSLAVCADPATAPANFDIEKTKLIDPFGGQADLRAKVLRHTSPAFREDPVRLLRLARFAARFGDFTVAPETQSLLRDIVTSGEVAALVPERVWQELARGLMEAAPSRMVAVLADCGAWQVLLPGLPPSEQLMALLDTCARLQAPLPVRYACLMNAASLAETAPSPLATAACALAVPVALCRVPADCRDLANLLAREQGQLQRSSALAPEGLFQLLERCDALRKPERFRQALLACECAVRSQPGQQDARFMPAAHLLVALAAAQGIATDSIASSAQKMGASGIEVGEKIRQARIAAIAENWPDQAVS